MWGTNPWDRCLWFLLTSCHHFDIDIAQISPHHNLKMDALERESQEATSEKKVPGVLLAAANLDGILRFLSISVNIWTTYQWLQHAWYLLLFEPFQNQQANDQYGSLNYFKAFGNYSPDPDSKPLSAESTFCLASATKLVTCVAAMQCVERGLINLDDDITTVLPYGKML